MNKLMKAIILAAGIGKRLRPITSSMPKCLIQFDGKTLIDNHFDSLGECGIRKAVLVVGYMAETLKRKLGDKYRCISIKYVHNRNYESSDSAYSLWLAKDEISKEPFIVADSDILFHKRIFEKLVNCPFENCLIADPFFADTGEEVKVAAEGGIVRQIGKRSVDHSKLVGEAIGLYKFSGNASSVLVDGLEKYMSVNGITSEYEDALNSILSLLKMHYVTTEGLPWIDIDFPEDLKKAELLVYPKL